MCLVWTTVVYVKYFLNIFLNVSFSSAVRSLILMQLQFKREMERTMSGWYFSISISTIYDTHKTVLYRTAQSLTYTLGATKVQAVKRVQRAQEALRYTKVQASLKIEIRCFGGLVLNIIYNKIF